MKDARRAELVSITRDQIVEAIKADLDGRGESLMKEAFEQCESRAESAVVYAEMRAIIKRIKVEP